MKLRLIIISLCLFLFSDLYAQTSLPSTCQVFYPSELSGGRNNLTIKESDVNKFLKNDTYGQNGTNTRKFWKVVSDRANNPVYSSSTSTSKIGSLEFNQDVTIVKIENKRALVADGTFRDSDYPRMPINAKSIGWVDMNKLLLWGSCPTDDSGIYYKALIAINLDSEGIKNSSTAGNLYYNPDTMENPRALISDKRFYYVMKRQGKLTLLATQYTIDKGFSNKVLLGWVPDNSYVPWNQRVCLEPNWKTADFTYFKQNSVTANVYSNLNFDKVGSKTNFAEMNGRLNGAELRFPLLSHPVKKSGGEVVYHISSFGTEDNKKDSTVEIWEVKKEVLEKMRRVNICLVIDGTESMRDYYPAVKKAIIDGCTQFIDESKVKVSVVIYRDKQHVKNGKSCEVEMLSFTNPRNPKLHSFLDTGGEFGFNPSNDPTAEESLYKGIDQGLSLFKGKEGESNIMILVGDCGDNARFPEITGETLVKKMNDLDLQFMAFQIANKTAPAAYGKFQNNVVKILKSNYEGFYKKLDPNVKVSLAPIPGESGYTCVNARKKMFFIGAARFPVLGQVMSADNLKNNIVSSINDLQKAVQMQIDIIVRGEAATTMDEEFIKGKVGTILKSQIYSFKGYTPKLHKSSQRPYYNTVLFISSEEYQNLIMKLSPVSKLAKNPALDRAQFISALKALTRAFVPDVTPEQMERMSIQEIMAIAGGIYEFPTAKWTIADIADAHKVSHAEYVSILRKFDTEFTALQKMLQSNYKYSMEFNGARYYWIPVEDLPYM